MLHSWHGIPDIYTHRNSSFSSSPFVCSTQRGLFNSFPLPFARYWSKLVTESAISRLCLVAIRYCRLNVCTLCSQMDALKTVTKDTVSDGDGRKEFGFTAKKPLPAPKAHSEQANIHPDDHSFENCRPPTITGNPSNKHNTTFGDIRIPGPYSNRTTYRETFKGPRSACKIVGEQSITELYDTPATRQHAYERALVRIGKKRVRCLWPRIPVLFHSSLARVGFPWCRSFCG